MKTKKYMFVVWLIMLGFICSVTQAQESYIVKRGERPPIDLQSLPVDAYEKGIIKIKLNESFTGQLDNSPVMMDENGTVRFNISTIDEMNQRYGATNYKKLFESEAFSPEFSDRHRAWGFHLWYTLYFDEQTDIVALLNAYDDLAEVTIAEPEYKKEMVGPVVQSFQDEPDKGDPNPSPSDWTPNDPSYGVQWHYHNTGQQSGTVDADIDLPEAWDIEKGNSDVIVSIQDQGIQYDHPDISGNMWSGVGYDFYNGDATIEPGYHGTHVAGTVAAETNNSTGVSGIAGGSGFNDGVRLMSCQVFTSSGSGYGFHLAPIYAADNDACISQNSWGYTSAGYYEQSVLDAIDYFNVNGGGDALIGGGITIYAAGNSNSNASYYPGYYSGTFAVAATNNQDIRSYYSNYGTWVDISAPGGETIVTERGVYSTYTTNTYAYLQGTSMACPHVSGVAALIISLAYGELTPADVADILSNTTDNHYAVNPSYIGQLGSGRLNAYQALVETQSYLSGVLNPQTFSASPFSTSQINLAWTKNASNNSVMVVWSPTGTFGAPANGTVYTAGQAIPGGGTVLYRGSNTSYNHTGLSSSTMYYYKAYSYDATNAYSSGKSTQAGTLCGSFSLPFSEDFNASASLPPCWAIIDNLANGQVWQFGTFSGGVSGTGGNYAYLNSDGYGSGNSQNSDLVTPALDLSVFTNVTLSFQHYFRQWSGSSGTLAYSIDNGSTWTTIDTWTTTTVNPASFNQVIAAVAGQSLVKFRWKYVGTWGYYWSVDNVSITGTPSALPPVANFTASTTTPVVGDVVTFTDNSTNTPTSWSWSFTPSTVQYMNGTNSGSQHPQVKFNAAGSYTVSLIATNAGGSDTETKNNYISASIPVYSLDLKAYLEGPFTGTGMDASLQTLIPLNQPFNMAPWNYAGSENVGSLPNLNVVDWILVDVREAASAALATGATSIQRKAAFILFDGSVVDLDGISNLTFQSVVTQNIYVVIWHRNHLGILSNNALVQSGGIYTYDFTTGVNQVYGGSAGHKELAPGKWGLFSGDGDRNGTIGTGDKSFSWDNEAGSKGYIFTDYNLDTQSNNIDKDDYWIPNIGKETKVPD